MIKITIAITAIIIGILVGAFQAFVFYVTVFGEAEKREWKVLGVVMGSIIFLMMVGVSTGPLLTLLDP